MVARRMLPAGAARVTARVAATVLLIGASHLTTGCASDDASPPPRGPAFAALLADGTVVGYTASGDEVARVRVGGRVEPAVSGAYISVLHGGRAPTQVVVIDASARPNALVVVDVERWTVVRRLTLPRRSLFRNVAVGRRTGRFYLGGDVATKAMTPFGSAANAAVIAIVDSDGKVLDSALVRNPRTTRGPVAPYDWSVYSLAVDEAAGRIYVSYHGPNTSGADSIDQREGGLVRCAGSGAGGVGCLRPVHGRVEAFRDGILGTTGTPPALVAFRPDATIERRWRSGFAGSAHLMEFARVGSRAFGLESCPKLGGLTSLDLDSGDARLIARPAPPGTARPQGVCGERLAARPGDLRVVVAKSVDGLGFVLFVDGRTGRIVASRRVAAPPLDVVAIR